VAAPAAAEANLYAGVIQTHGISVAAIEFPYNAA